ncbi:MAG: bifunctional UDP-N-acetylmuramoyl-tripeptide:D-alanyl-D-alanine ligase/alanine racemase [Candidatus Symbiothrix sp.]|jgi:alanine racemase|nr:bifunctional UDP-N-acetylmuramoyl-tripeptide:D-alanyl-D-alanine ligase/alanine racemase [Candidatus Symbiothrix sp.]
MTHSIIEIGSAIHAHTTSLQDAEIRILLTDSRSLSEAAATLFFALPTEHNDGHRYIADLYEKGVRNFVVQHDFDGRKRMPDANCLWVNDTLTALQQLASLHRQLFDIPVIGITGSNGKTIVKEWLYQLLHDRFSVVRSPRSYNSQTGVPLSVWQLNEQTQLGIFEAGISLPNEMEKLESIIRPTIGIFTTLGEAHQENFASQEEKCLEKLKLFASTDTIIYNEDQTVVKYCMEKADLVTKTIAWSVQNKQASLFISNIEKAIDHTRINAQWNLRPCEHAISIQIPFTDDASIENAIHCLALTLFLAPDLSDLPSRFDKLDPVAMRLDVSKGINGNILINDTYNSDINSLSIALDFMARRSGENQLKQVLILSDILQSGLVPAAFYRKVAALVEQNQVQHIIGIGPNLLSHSNLFGMEKDFFPTTESFLHSGIWRKLKHSLILIKGSRQSRFERISEQLSEKAHQTILEVNLDAIIHNLKHFRSKLRPATKVICMVKAFGYGIGSYELAKTLQERGADYLAVALADEGAELRREGITMPIMVMNPEEHAFNTLLEYHLEPEIYNLNLLEAIIHETKRRGIVNYPIHIKLDTGMSRLGFDRKDIPLAAEKLNEQNGVTVKSVFSHLAGSDSPLLDDFTHQQIEQFTQESKALEQLLGYPVWRHILNSAGIERFAEAQFDLVRLGIGLYGISAIDNALLKPVATLKTRILQIREIEPDVTVGYNRNGVISRKSRIACIPIGYADGLDRRLGNGKGNVLINGQLCPFIGNICMDICMVDVTNIAAKEGDTAIIFGEQITISRLAEQLETIPYEILTSISPRVKRIYYKE